MDAGFLNVVEIGQYFHDERHCRILTIRRCSGLSWIHLAKRRRFICNQKVGSKGTPRLDPYWKLQPVACTANMELRSESCQWKNTILTPASNFLNGSNKFVTNLNNNEQETSEMQFEEYALKLDARDFACRSKAKAKPQRREPAGPSTRTIPVGERTWTDVEPGEYSISDYAVSKKLIHLLRHGRQVHREDDGAIEFWRIKDDLQKHFLHCYHWSDDKWKKGMGGGGGNKKRYKYCADSSGAILYVRALQGHSGRSLIDPTLQDNVVIPNNFFQYIYHVGCAINLHSIINSGLTPEGQNLSNRQTVFFLLVNHMEKNHKDPETIDLNAPRHAQYMHKAWKRHQDTVYWVAINLALRKGLKFYQTRSNAIILHETLPTCCIPKVVRMETGEVIYEKVFVSPRPPPKISLKHDWKRELGSEDAQRPHGQVVQQF